MEKRLYEAMLIFASNLPEDKREDLIKKYSKMAGETRVEKLGMRKFATPINYRNEGFYVLLHFAGTPTAIAEMTKSMRITDGVERFLFVAKDEKQIAYDAERKAKRAAARESRETSAPAPQPKEETKGE